MILRCSCFMVLFLYNTNPWVVEVNTWSKALEIQWRWLYSYLNLLPRTELVVQCNALILCMVLYSSSFWLCNSFLPTWNIFVVWWSELSTFGVDENAVFFDIGKSRIVVSIVCSVAWTGEHLVSSRLNSIASWILIDIQNHKCSSSYRFLIWLRVYFHKAVCSIVAH